MEGNSQNFSDSTRRDKISTPELALPKGGGAIKGIGETFQPNPFSGTGNLSIPIYASPCRNFEPRLSLDYSSGSGNGIFGIGFSISIPNISRKTERGIPRYDDSDTFIFSNSEELVPKLVQKNGGVWAREERRLSQDGTEWNVSSFLPRIEGMFAKIELWKNARGSFWKVVEKNNVTSIYGLSDNARIADPDDKSRIFKWLIEKSYDAKGNKIEFFYKQENNENVPDRIYEQNRTYTANKYIQNIRYGNYLDDGGQEKWAFEVVFDYGEYDMEDEYLSKASSNPYIPSKKWPARLDPFSYYRSGFEIRTCRLCRNILLFHRFEQELGVNPCLVRATRLTYEQTPEMSKLLAVEVKGYRKKEDGSYESRPMPPLEFTYSQFNPAGRKFSLLEVEKGVTVPGYINQSQFNLVDLYGDGIPGFLYSDDKTTLYWRPKGNGRYGYPESPVLFPIDRDLKKAEYSLMSLEGNGKLDLVVGSPNRGGFYESNTDGSWEPYRSFVSYPTDFANPQKLLVDADGDGLSDIIIFEDYTVKVYPSLKKEGFGPPVRANIVMDEDGGFPAAGNDYAREVVSFADMFGDGLSHRVRIRNGSVECWPNLGYGRFGKKVHWGDAPRFGDALDASRLFFADIDGSGTQDLVYVHSDRIEVYLNQGGNSFGKPISISLPEAYTGLDGISFADVLGNGSACLIFTKMGTNIRHYYYYFSGEIKPYLLIETDNNLGAITRVSYKSSVKYFLEDKQAGNQWKTRLPFPVQVVEKVESIDRISGSKMVSGYKYHDGYYDYAEREFRGFGFVEEWDTETFDEFSTPGLLKEIVTDKVEKELHVPPVYTRRWYHTGAYIEAGIISKHYEEEYYNGDPQAYRMPDSTFDARVDAGDAETIRQAYAALKGQKIREEVYALDEKQGISEHPYFVTETSFHVKEVQPRIFLKYASFFVHEKENVNFNYERNPRDPRVQHHFTLETDPFGNVLKSCQVFYPRRVPGGGTGTVAGAPLTHPEQLKMSATAGLNRYINNAGDFWLIGISSESKTFEIGGLDLRGQSYFSFSQILGQIEDALQNPIAFEEEFTAGKPQARLLTWELDFYWNQAQDDYLPAGEITELALLHHTEEAVFSPGLLKLAFNDRATPEILEKDGGYILRDGYWWNRGVVQYFYKELDNRFYLPYSIENSFAGNTPALHVKTDFAYDRYCLSPIITTQYLENEITNVTSALIDYNTLQLKQITDINGTVSQALFDPLGMAIVTSIFGAVDGKPEGDTDLKGYNRDVLNYSEKCLRGDASFKDVLENPGKYLQGATTFFYYDLYGFKDKGQPACSINLVRETHVNNDEGIGETGIQVQISYSDGFGRDIEKKMKVDPGQAVLRDGNGDLIFDASNKIMQDTSEERWLVSGRTVYNNKARPVKQYFPYFSTTPYYEDQKEVEPVLPDPTITYYDPLLRVIRIDTPKGFFSKVEFTPWEERHFDENDTVKDSEYYINFMHNYPENPTREQKDEKDALDKAACFYNTPGIKVLDNTGNTFLKIRNNLGEVAEDAFKSIVEGKGVSSGELWNELSQKGYLEVRGLTGPGGWVSDKFQPYLEGFKLQLEDKYIQFEDGIVNLLKENCLTTYHELDVEGNILTSIDPRLYYSNVKNKSAYYNYKAVYNMQGKPISVNSSDAGLKLTLNNIFGKLIHTWDGRGFHQSILYDRLQRAIQINVEGNDGKGLILNQPVEKMIYGEYYGEKPQDSRDKNLRGQIYKHFDQAGVVLFYEYNIHGKALQTSRQLRQDYKNEVNWENPDTVKLEDEIFITAYKYDALNRVTTEATHDGSIYKPGYNQAGALQTVDVTFKDGNKQGFIKDIQYNPDGQRAKIAYGNGVVTDFVYECSTRRLTGIMSKRPGTGVKGVQRDTTLQNIVYIYDPVGNITRVRDDSYQAVFCNQQVVEPLSDYTFNALYQLTYATGRQHPGIWADTHKYGFKQSVFRPFSPPHPNDGEKLEAYQEIYTYDDSGNLVNIRHRAQSASWARETGIAPGSNRTVQVSTQNGSTDLCKTDYDPDGNMLNLDNLNAINWNYRNNISRVDVILRENDNSDSDYYIYDSSGQRTRKVIERKVSGTITEIEEKIYLGSLEIKRIKKKNETSENTILDRQTLHVMGDQRRIALTYFWLKDDNGRETQNTEERKFRFQLDNNLQSSCLEVDHEANLISYEEYFPYGGTSIIAGDDVREVSLKEYRYSGKERDDSTGLYYYGARYYISWLGRWMSPDPAGTVDGLNLYAFVGGNPVSKIDIEGNCGFFSFLFSCFCCCCCCCSAEPLSLSDKLSSLGIKTKSDGDDHLVHYGINEGASDNRYRSIGQVGGLTMEAPWRKMLSNRQSTINTYDVSRFNPNDLSRVDTVRHSELAGLKDIDKWTQYDKDVITNVYSLSSGRGKHNAGGIREGIEFSKRSIEYNLSRGDKTIVFHIDKLDIGKIIKGEVDNTNSLYNYSNSVTAKEFKYILRLPKTMRERVVFTKFDTQSGEDVVVNIFKDYENELRSFYQRHQVRQLGQIINRNEWLGRDNLPQHFVAHQNRKPKGKVA